MIDQLAELFQSVSVLVVGDVMLDEYIIGSVSRISPEAPVPVLDVRTRRFVLGGAGNVAANISAFGSHVTVVGLASTDFPGVKVRELFHSAGIGSDGLVDCGDRGTIHKTRIVAGQQQVVRIDHEDRSPLDQSLQDAAITHALRLLDGKQVLVLSDYSKGLLTGEVCATLIDESRRRRIPVIVDPKAHDFKKYRGCTAITPNLSEAALATGMTIDSEAKVLRAGEYLLAVLPETSILITRGANGMTLFHTGQSPITVPTVARQVFDVVGAGDTVIATLAVSLGAGIKMPLSMRLANIAAGIVVEKPGTATTSVEEILAHDTIGDVRNLAVVK